MTPIQLGSDGLTLFFTLPDGTKYTKGFRDGDPYQNLANILNAQQQAEKENTATRTAYLGALHLFQNDLDAGRAQGLTPPVVPIAKYVDVVMDPDGNPHGFDKTTLFSPALPLPVYPPPPQSHGIGPDAHPVVLDPFQSAILASLEAAHKKLDALLAKT